jgi:hypothetical protein
MANGRGGSKRSKHQVSRDAGGFIALPYSVVDSPNFQKLSTNAKALLLEVGRQLRKDNNGRLLLSKAHLLPRGWKSSDMIFKGKKELLDGGFIYETVMGHRPNKASWYAITWQTIDKLDGYDYGALSGYRKGAYDDKFKTKFQLVKPSDGSQVGKIAPPVGIRDSVVVPQSGTMKRV